MNSRKRMPAARRRGIALLAALALLCGLVGGSLHTPRAAAAETDASFEQLLETENFPESYRAALRELHRQYPNWVFRAQHTGLSWDEVLDAQSAVGTSLVPASSIASWKSCEQGAYDPAAGRWYGLDSSEWVAASREMVAYCLDPRNFLNETAIFQFENLAYSDTCTVEGVKGILSGTFMENMAAAFVAAGKAAGVSPYHLASRARQEQGSSGNALGRGTVAGYEGYYNLFNINAYATSTLTAMQNGARYAATTNSAYLLPWKSAEQSLKGGAIILGSSYINREQNTLYLQKFDVTDGGNGYFRHQYMTNILAPSSEASTLAAAYSDTVKAGALEFCVPVYLDMPQSACAKPSSSGDNNNWLSALSVEGQTLTPTFSLYTTAYELTVPNAVASLTVRATASGGKATVKGTGTVSLAAGSNTLPITVTAASGVTRTYTLTVYRAPAQGDGSGEVPALTSARYRVSSDIRGVSPGTGASAFVADFTAEGASLALVTAAGLPRTDTVATGDRLQVIQNGALCASYPVVIRGEVNGDGAINSLDLLRTQKSILGLVTLDAPAAAAADANADGTVNALDLLRIQRHILELTVIEQ